MQTGLKKKSAEIKKLQEATERNRLELMENMEKAKARHLLSLPSSLETLSNNELHKNALILISFQNQMKFKGIVQVEINF